LTNWCKSGAFAKKKSLAKLAQQADISVSSARTATKLPNLCPYKNNTNAFITAKKPSCKDKFFKLVIQSVNKGTLHPQLLFYTDETWFHLNRHLNMHNNLCWSSENPRVLHEARHFMVQKLFDVESVQGK
jgi:hypothetical protein